MQTICSKLSSDFGLLDRNLDFTDLDDIDLNDNSMMFSGLDLYGSSIRNLKIINSQTQFFSLRKCFCSNLAISGSSISKLDINDCSMNEWELWIFN